MKLSSTGCTQSPGTTSAAPGDRAKPEKEKDMKCPVDGEILVVSERNGVEIDYCPQCRGVWLDRGELDKIIDRSAPAPAHVETAGYERTRDVRKKRKESFLGELFDF